MDASDEDKGDFTDDDVEYDNNVAKENNDTIKDKWTLNMEYVPETPNLPSGGKNYLLAPGTHDESYGN